MSSVPTITSPARSSILEPMNLHNTVEFNELLRQRILCGWKFTPSSLERWRTLADAGTLFNFWAVPDSHADLPAPQRWVGHISMVPKVENDMPVRHIANLFILRENRLGGLGRRAVGALEAWAKSEGINCMTLNALCRRYVEGDGEEWRGMYLRLCESLGIEKPVKGTSNEDWYVRQGYVVYGGVPLYPVELDGVKFLLLASLLRKELV